MSTVKSNAKESSSSKKNQSPSLSSTRKMKGKTLPSNKYSDKRAQTVVLGLNKNNIGLKYFHPSSCLKIINNAGVTSVSRKKQLKQHED